MLVGGPNGAGKTTFINTYLPEYTNVREYVNADLIAKGISPFDPEGATIEAGRVVLARVHQLLGAGKSFTLETTLSGRAYVSLLQKAKQLGYRLELYYIYLNSVEISMNRISERVLRGGHDIPPDAVFRRYDRSLRNLFELYMPLSDAWYLFDNSGAVAKRVAAMRGEELSVTDQRLYSEIQNRYGQLRTGL